MPKFLKTSQRGFNLKKENRITINSSEVISSEEVKESIDCNKGVFIYGNENADKDKENILWNDGRRIVELRRISTWTKQMCKHRMLYAIGPEKHCI